MYRWANPEHTALIRERDGATIPATADNCDFADAMAWAGAGNTFAAYLPPAPTPSDVQAERAKRLAAGFDYDFGGARGVHRIGTTLADMAGWDEVSKLAAALVATGAGSTAIQIVTDTGFARVTALEWQGVLVAAAQFRQPIWAASFALQSMSPIPDDYAANHDFWT